MDTRLPQIGIRVTPEFRARIQSEAEKRFGGNASLLVREATTLYLQMREKLGPRFEPSVAALIGDEEPVAA